MGQQVVMVDEKTYFQQVKVRMEHLRSDARAVLDAIRSDSVAVRKSMATLRDKSELRSFFQSRTKDRTAVKAAVETRKLAKKKPAASDSTRTAAH